MRAKNPTACHFLRNRIVNVSFISTSGRFLAVDRRHLAGLALIEENELEIAVAETKIPGSVLVEIADPRRVAGQMADDRKPLPLPEVPAPPHGAAQDGAAGIDRLDLAGAPGERRRFHVLEHGPVM